MNGYIYNHGMNQLSIVLGGRKRYSDFRVYIKILI